MNTNAEPHNNADGSGRDGRTSDYLYELSLIVEQVKDLDGVDEVEVFTDNSSEPKAEIVAHWRGGES